MTERINQPDNAFTGIKNLMNFIGLASCWISVAIDIVYFAVTANLLYFLLIAMWTPARYFFFDMAPSKLQKRPASLDRTIPLTIFVNYLSKSFPIPNGNILATICGFLLACARAMVNGYALLFFDTFSFLYSVKNDSKGLPLNDSLNVEEFSIPQETALESDQDGDQDRLEEAKLNWQEERVITELDRWAFPIRRYRIKPNYYFENNEVDAQFLVREDEQKEDAETKK